MIHLNYFFIFLFDLTVQLVTHSLNQWPSNPAPTLGLMRSGLINMPRALKCDTTDYWTYILIWTMNAWRVRVKPHVKHVISQNELYKWWSKLRYIFLIGKNILLKKDYFMRVLSPSFFKFLIIWLLQQVGRRIRTLFITYQNKNKNKNRTRLKLIASLLS